MFLSPVSDVTNSNKSEKLRELRVKAVLAEYNDLRDSIKRRVDQRTHISYFVIAIMVGVLGLYVTSENPLILVLAPSVLMYWLSIIDSSYSHNKELTKYIREEIEVKKLPLLIGKVNYEEGWINWETYYSKDDKKRYSSRFKVYVISSWFICVTCGLAIYGNVSETLFLLYWSFYGVFMTYFSCKCLKYYFSNIFWINDNNQKSTKTVSETSNVDGYYILWIFLLSKVINSWHSDVFLLRLYSCIDTCKSTIIFLLHV